MVLGFQKRGDLEPAVVASSKNTPTSREPLSSRDCPTVVDNRSGVLAEFRAFVRGLQPRLTRCSPAISLQSSSLPGCQSPCSARRLHRSKSGSHQKHLREDRNPPHPNRKDRPHRNPLLPYRHRQNRLLELAGVEPQVGKGIVPEYLQRSFWMIDGDVVVDVEIRVIAVLMLARNQDNPPIR